MIRIETHLADSPLTGQSKWWGEPDMPEELDWPTVMVRDEDGESYDDPLTFVCQIRCADLKSETAVPTRERANENKNGCPDAGRRF